MQPPQPPRGPFPGSFPGSMPGSMPGGPPPQPLGRTGAGMPALGQSSFGMPPLPPGPPPGMAPGGMPPAMGQPMPPGMGMGQPVPPGMATAPGLGGPTPGLMPVGQPGMVPPGVVRRQPVFYGYRRMKRGQMYPMTIKIEAEGPGRATEAGAAEPLVTVQPVIPGAMVTPNTCDIQLQPGAEAVFSVLPMASGKLTGARVDILRQGRKLTTMNIPMRTQRGRFMTFMALLTLGLLLLVWSGWEPKYTQVTEQLVAAGPRLSPDGNPLPPDPNAKPEIQKVETKFEGAEAIEQFLKVNGGKLGFGSEPAKDPRGIRDWSSFDFLVAGMQYIKPVLMGAYNVLHVIRTTPLGDLYLLACLAGFALLVSFLRRPRRTKLAGPLLEVRA